MEKALHFTDFSVPREAVKAKPSHNLMDENEEPPAVGEESVQDQLRNLKVLKSLGPEEMHL